jgi:hypothetical protein
LLSGVLGGRVADAETGVSVPVLERRQGASDVGAEVGKATPVDETRVVIARGAREAPELVRVRLRAALTSLLRKLA